MLVAHGVWLCTVDCSLVEAVGYTACASPDVRVWMWLVIIVLEGGVVQLMAVLCHWREIKKRTPVRTGRFLSVIVATAPQKQVIMYFLLRPLRLLM